MRLRWPHLLAGVTLLLLAACGGGSSSTPAPPPALLSIAIAPAPATTGEGARQQLTITGTYSDQTTGPVTSGLAWMSDNDAVATVDASGLATGVSPGTASIMATHTAPDLTDTVTLTVTILQTITVTPDSGSFPQGGALQFTAMGQYSDTTTQTLAVADWSTDDPNVATVDAAGLAHSVTTGSANITATHARSGFSGSTTVTVTPPTGITYWKTSEIAVPAGTPSGGAAILSVNIPAASNSIGIALQGTNTNLKFIDHGLVLLDAQNQPVYITGPAGIAPLSFNYTDFNQPGVNDIDNFISLLLDFQITSLFFPNDGSTQTLPAGTYKFPVGSFNATATMLEADTLQPYIYYKTASAQQPTLRLNVFVVSGINGITTAPQALADAEIQGALNVLRNVYERNLSTAVKLALTVDVVPDPAYATLETVAERDLLFSSYPTVQANDAMNIFIVSALAYTDSGVIGEAARIPGPFNRQGSIRSGTVAEYQGDGAGTILGFILAHEFGHFLGLYHSSQTDPTQTSIVGFDPVADTPVCTTLIVSQPAGIDGCPDRNNLMFPIVAPEPNPIVTAGQGTVIRLNPAVTVP